MLLRGTLWHSAKIFGTRQCSVIVHGTLCYFLVHRGTPRYFVVLVIRDTRMEYISQVNPWHFDVLHRYS